MVVNVHSADIIATLLALKKEVEEKSGNAIRLTIGGGTESHLLADELAEANVSGHPHPLKIRTNDRKTTVGVARGKGLS